MNVHFTFQVPKSPDLDELINRAVKKLDHLLVVFQPELVQLHGRFVRHTAREGTICQLNLRLPTGQFASEEAADTAQGALRAAISDLVDQIKKHKEKLRTEQNQRAKLRNLKAQPPELPSPEEPPAAKEKRREDLARYISVNIDRLQDFVQRQIQLRERLGDIQPGQVEVREVLDEMIANALSDEGLSLERFERERWLLLLAVNSIRKLVAQSRDGLDEDTSLPLDRDIGEADLRQTERFQYVEPDEEDLQVRDLTTDQTVATPEEIAYSSELLSLLESALQRLPPEQREDLVLFALEGFSVNELALISQRAPEQVKRAIQEAQKGLEKQTDIPGDLRRMLVERTQQRLSGAA